MYKWRRTNVSRSRPSPPAGAIAPLLPTLVSTIPEGNEWIHEIKWDGYRISVNVDHGKARVFTRNLYDWTERFPKIVAAVLKLDAVDAIIDGEAIVADDRGLSSFARLQQALGKGGWTSDIEFVAFDLLRLNGQSLLDRPLAERCRALTDLLGDKPRDGIIFSDEIPGDPDRIFANACTMGIEGVVSKRRDSLYRSGRRLEWLKTKCVQSDEFVPIGYRPGEGFGGIGKLLVASIEQGELIYAGGVGTGFSTQSGTELRRRLDSSRVDKAPVSGPTKRGTLFSRPEMVVEIEYRGWTEDHHLRHAAFKGIREDKSVADLMEEMT